MRKEMTTMSFAFGPDERYVLHIPMKREELQQSIQRFAQALTGASLISTARNACEDKKEADRQLAFEWAEPICSKH